ncbi:MAG: XRE family transcriptional regulator [Myxococcota bacterium]|jgi:XRE family transcriptional regulator, regulator of sulfur utilization|nr:XRE family transcriptional regulator [Myxococcota bacterium]
MVKRGKAPAKSAAPKAVPKKRVADRKSESDEAASGAADDESEDASASRPARARTNTAAGDDIGAAELANRVAEALKRFRRDRHLSFDELSARSGVSRAALSQIEGGRTNPTLAVLWKIAVGLDVPFHDLLGTNTEETVHVLRAGDALPLRSADGRTESRLLSPGGVSTNTDVYELRLTPKAVHRSDPHARGTTETLVVLTGALRLVVGSQTHELATGDSVHFRADVAHSYENRSTRETRLLDVIHYARG